MDASTDRAVAPLGRIERLRDGYVLAFDRQYDYPRSFIWNLLTDPAKVHLWLGTLAAAWELGKEYSLELGGGVVTGSVLQLNPPTSLQITWDDELGGESILEWRVLESDGGTLLQLRARSGTADFMTEGAAGWQLILSALDDVAAGHEVHPVDDWAATRDAYAAEFGLSNTMGAVEVAEGVTMVHFDRRYEAKLPMVKDAVTSDPDQQTRVEQAEVDFTTIGNATLVTIRHVVEEPAAIHALMAQWHAHLDAVDVALGGGQPHASARKLHALEDFYRASISG
ncbi:SRPBCC domain-containing protein [Arthrobacter sp. H5]|uniref:SRPBCC domain-containing protein n=1 Tax=Arthrobacter sp. H5 TaxID=1267973 RepID=UPI0004801D06|nr:SRPBCC domain-containing protein [Arthrobacter sp. H5]